MNVISGDIEIMELIARYKAIGELLLGLDKAMLTDKQVEVIGHIRYGFPLSENNKLMDDAVEIWKEFKYSDRRDMFNFDGRMFANYKGNYYVYDGERLKPITIEMNGLSAACADTCP